MKDDVSTPRPDGLSPNEFEKGKHGTNARSDAEAAIEELRQLGGVFVNAVRATRMPMALTDPNLPGNPIVFANEAFLKLTGYSMKEVLGQKPHFMNGPDTDPKDAARFTEAIRADQDDIIETVQYRKSGSRFIATVLLSAFKDEQGHTINHFMSWLDVTRRVEAEDEVAGMKRVQAALRASEAHLETELRYTNLLRDLGAQLVKEESVTAIVEEILSAAVAIMESDAGTVQVYDPEGRALVLLVTHRIPTEMVDHFHRVDASSNTACGQSLRTGKRTFVDFDQEGADEACLMHVAAGLRSAQATPLLSRSGSPIGMLNTHWRESGHRPSADQLRFLDLLARQAADLIERAKAEDALRESETRLAVELEKAKALQAASSLLITDGESGPLYEQIINAAMAIMDAQFGSLQLLHSERGQLELIAWRNFHPESAAYWQQVDVVTGTSCGSALARGDRVIISDVEESESLSGTESLRQYRVSGIKAVQSTPLSARNGTIIGMISTHWRKPHAPQETELRLFDVLARQAADFIERTRAEEALRESEARLAAAFESVPAGLAVLDLKGRAIITNAEFRRFLPTGVVPSHDPERINRWKGWSDDGRLLDPRDWPSARALRGESVIPGQEMLYTDDEGRNIWTNVATAPIFDSSCNVTGVVSVVSDIHNRKQAEEDLQLSERHAQMLLAELQHRVRNTLAVIRSIARRTAENCASSEEMLAHFQGRLDAFSRVQAALTRNPEGTVDLAAVVADELLAHAAQSGKQVHVEGPEFQLEPKMAERLSLALHELTTNAIKHGALRDGKGRVHIAWATKQNGEGEELVLDWTESGVKIETKPTREGFGMELLRALPYDIGGTTNVDFNSSGLSFELRVPLTTAA